MDLCQICANKKSDQALHFDAPFSFQHLLSGLLNFDASLYGSGKNIIKDKVEILKCDTCGLTYQQFSKSGRFGCADCYRAFTTSLHALFRRIHGHTTHRGKIPEHVRQVIFTKRELEQLKEQLAIKIQQEEFEEAAKLRDQIKSLQQDH